MRRLLVSASVVLTVLMLGIIPSSAGNPAQDSMVLDPTSGPPGTEISVTGTGCVTKGDVEVVVVLLDTTLELQDSDVVEPTFDGFSGDWEATLTVPADAIDYGEWTVRAACRIEAVEDAAVAPAGLQILIDYIPRLFIVTEPAQEPPPPPVEEPPAAAPVDAVPDFTG